MSSSRGGTGARRRFVSAWDEIGYLRGKVLHWFYGPAHSRTKARPFARRLERLLLETESAHEAMLGQECWSLVREVEGDLRGAIEHRRREVRLWKKLLALPGYRDLDASIVGSHADLSDRLLLLALLYLERKNQRRALECLEEARSLAEQHGFCFEGEDLLEQASARGKSRAAKVRA